MIRRPQVKLRILVQHVQQEVLDLEEGTASSSQQLLRDTTTLEDLTHRVEREEQERQQHRQGQVARSAR